MTTETFTNLCNEQHLHTHVRKCRSPANLHHFLLPLPLPLTLFPPPSPTAGYSVVLCDRTTRPPPKEWEVAMWTTVMQGTQEAAIVMLASHLATSSSFVHSILLAYPLATMCGLMLICRVWSVSIPTFHVCLCRGTLESSWRQCLAGRPQLPADMLKRVIVQCSKTCEGRRVMVEMVSDGGDGRER